MTENKPFSSRELGAAVQPLRHGTRVGYSNNIDFFRAERSSQLTLEYSKTRVVNAINDKTNVA